ncbi:MAG TPA: efflux RND transporter periplasmic adaptor subunit [Bryobacteraceae bacterium]|nr:efflux RND transporter periplasmic adaptor subunit [Bryobacteraceae bacterium]
MAVPHRTAVWLVVPALLAFYSCKRESPPMDAAAALAAMPPVPVSVAKATTEAVPVSVNAVGTVEAMATAQIQSRVAGQLLRAEFREGQLVAKDQLLFLIDPQPFRENLKQAEAELARDRAELRQSEATMARDLAQAKHAASEAKRYAQLVAAGDISKSQADRVDTDAAVARESARAAQAQIERMKAAIDADLSAIDRAKLELSWCEIRAPFAGRTGAILAHPGNLIKASDTPLVVLHQTAPVWVSFTVPETFLNQVRQRHAQGKMPVHAGLREQPDVAATGLLAVIDNGVDATTGAIRLKATFENKDGRLWHGQFVNVSMTLNTLQDATVVPAQAVQSGQQGDFVYVVKGDGTAEMRPVEVLHAAGIRTVLGKGVNPGDTVVTDGHLRLFPGAKIQAVDANRIDATKL